MLTSIGQSQFQKRLEIERMEKPKEMVASCLGPTLAACRGATAGLGPPADHRYRHGV